jgi:maltose/moltooligosaccharide transporter
VFGGPILRNFFGGQGILILVFAGVIMILGAISVIFVKQVKVKS